MKEPNATDEIGEHRFGEFEVISRVERRLGSENLLEPLRERKRSALDLTSDGLSWSVLALHLCSKAC